MQYNVISLTNSFTGLLLWRWEGREKTPVAGLVFILIIHENTNVRISAVNSAFWLIEWMFLKPTCKKIFSEISMWDSLFWLGRTANSVVFMDFAVMHTRAVTCFTLSVEREKLVVTKILLRRFKMCLEFSLLKVIPFRRWYAVSARDLCLRRVNSDQEVKLCKSTWNVLEESSKVLTGLRDSCSSQWKDCKVRISGILLCDRYNRRGGSLNIFLSCAGFCFKCHFPNDYFFQVKQRRVELSDECVIFRQTIQQRKNGSLCLKAYTSMFFFFFLLHGTVP